MTFLKIPYFFFSCLTFPLTVPLNEKMIAFSALISVFMMEKKKITVAMVKFYHGVWYFFFFTVGRAIYQSWI